MSQNVLQILAILAISTHFSSSNLWIFLAILGGVVGSSGLGLEHNSKSQVHVLGTFSWGGVKNAILDGCSTVDSTLNYDGTRWYYMVFDGIRRYH